MHKYLFGIRYKSTPSKMSNLNQVFLQVIYTCNNFINCKVQIFILCNIFHGQDNVLQSACQQIQRCCFGPFDLVGVIRLITRFSSKVNGLFGFDLPPQLFIKLLAKYYMWIITYSNQVASLLRLWTMPQLAHYRFKYASVVGVKIIYFIYIVAIL